MSSRAVLPGRGRPLRRGRGRPLRRAVGPALVVGIAAALGCGGSFAHREVAHLPADYNYAFYDTYPEAARSFYAAHHAHFGVYETALTDGADDGEAFERLRRRVLRLLEDPPKFEPPPARIAPEWVAIAWPTARSMDWTHMLHSQLYDILTDEGVDRKRAAGRRAVAYYLSEPEVAFSTRPYGHAFMQCGGTWAGTFRRKYPSINGLLWAYHWHHAAVYEALMTPDSARRRQELRRVIHVFRDSVVADPPERMPLTREVAPRFAAMFPAAANIFDNLHMMHDVVNDIMVDPRVEDKGFEIERLRRLMVYENQGSVIPPAPADGHDMHAPVASATSAHGEDAIRGGGHGRPETATGGERRGRDTELMERQEAPCVAGGTAR